tara:strand:+ start:6771 stop:6893 length:123 start_codon:yes stop_codon:yes gene_type:complete
MTIKEMNARMDKWLAARGQKTWGLRSQINADLAGEKGENE